MQSHSYAAMQSLGALQASHCDLRQTPAESVFDAAHVLGSQPLAAMKNWVCMVKLHHFNHIFCHFWLEALKRFGDLVHRTT